MVQVTLTPVYILLTYSIPQDHGGRTSALRIRLHEESGPVPRLQEGSKK